jgi:hypothetical protein
MKARSRRGLFTSALEIPDRLMTDLHDKQEKLQALAPERSLP